MFQARKPSMPRAVVVVPCFNEARRLNLPAIQDFGRRTERVELLFVDDGSRDETFELVDHLHRVNPRRFRCLRLATNRGKAEAVRQGVLAALDGRPEYLGYWDADLAAPLADIETFARVLDDKPTIDLVVGTRMRLLGHKIERHPLRYALGRCFATTASCALGIRIFDTQCGAKLFRVTPGTASLFGQPFSTRWIFDVELLARMKLARRSAAAPPAREAIYEVPLDAWRDVRGSTVRSGDFLKALGEMGRIYWKYLRPGAGCPSYLANSSPARALSPDLAAASDQQRAA
jgi:dolichyl-phosphate beta-glucosyltransferase